MRAGSRPCPLHRLVFAVRTCPSCLWGSSPTPGDVPLPSQTGARAPTSPTEPPGTHLVLLDLRPENVELLQPQLPAAIRLPVVKEHSRSTSVRAPCHPAGTAPTACFRGAPAEAPHAVLRPQLRLRAARVTHRSSLLTLGMFLGLVWGSCPGAAGSPQDHPPTPSSSDPSRPERSEAGGQGARKQRKTTTREESPVRNRTVGGHFPQPLRKPARAARAQASPTRLSRTGGGSAARKDTSSMSTMILQVSMLKPSDLMSWPRKQRKSDGKIPRGCAVPRNPPRTEMCVCALQDRGHFTDFQCHRGLARKREESRACICHVSLCPRRPRSPRTRLSRATVLH